MIVEDQDDFRDLMKVLLEGQPDIKLVAQAGSPTAAVLDPGLPDGSGADLTAYLRQGHSVVPGQKGVFVTDVVSVGRR